MKIIQPFIPFFNLKKDVKALGFVDSSQLSYCHVQSCSMIFLQERFKLVL